MAFAADSASWLASAPWTCLLVADFTPKCSSLVNGKPGKPVPEVLHFGNARVTVRGGAQIQRGLVQVIVP